jgi:hypothetical protein
MKAPMAMATGLDPKLQECVTLCTVALADADDTIKKLKEQSELQDALIKDQLGQIRALKPAWYEHPAILIGVGLVIGVQLTKGK